MMAVTTLKAPPARPLPRSMEEVRQDAAIQRQACILITVPSPDAACTIEVGWDPQRRSFFGQVRSGDDLRNWYGWNDQQFRDLDAFAAMMRRHVDLPPETRLLLLRARGAE